MKELFKTNIELIASKYGIKDTSDLNMLISKQVDVAIYQTLGLGNRYEIPTDLTIEKAEEYSLRINQRITELWTHNEGGSFRIDETINVKAEN